MKIGETSKQSVKYEVIFDTKKGFKKGMDRYAYRQIGCLLFVNCYDKVFQVCLLFCLSLL